jgi:hypothetical protein
LVNNGIKQLRNKKERGFATNNFKNNQSTYMICVFAVFRIGLVQLAVTANKAQNLLRAKEKIKEAVAKGAKIVALPVRQNTPLIINNLIQFCI